MTYKSKKLFFTIIVSGMAYVVNYAITFFLTPYITKNIGTEAYGFVTLANNFASYAGIITIALNSYATRFIAVAYHRGEREKCNTYFSSVFFANLVVGAAILLVFCGCIWKLEFLLKIPDAMLVQVKLLFFLIAVNFSIVTIGTVFSASAYIKNQLDKANFFRGCSYLAEAVALILCFVCFAPKVWYVGIGTIVSSVVIVGSNYILYRRYTPDIVLTRKKFSFKSVKQLFVKGVWNSVNSLGNALNSGLDLIIANLMLSSLAMGQLAIAESISTIFYAVFQLLSQPFQPIFLEDYSKKNKGRLLENLKKSIKLCGLFSNITFAGFFSLGLTFYHLWIPGQDVNLIWKLTVVAVLGSIVEGAVYPLYYIYTLTVKNRFPCLVTVVGGVANVAGMYLLLTHTHMGVFAIVITTAVIMTAINLIFNPIYMTRCLGIPWYTFYPELIRHILSCVLMTVAFSGIARVLAPQGWGTLILTCLLCCVVGTAIHMLIVKEKIYKFGKVLRGHQ